MVRDDGGLDRRGNVDEGISALLSFLYLCFVDLISNPGATVADEHSQRLWRLTIRSVFMKYFEEVLSGATRGDENFRRS